MKVTLFVNFFSANNDCTVAIYPNDYKNLYLTEDAVYDYDNLREMAYMFGFSGVNPEGGKIVIKLEVNGAVKYNKTVTKTGYYAYKTTIQP